MTARGEAGAVGPRPSPLRSPGMFTYSIVPRAPFRAGKLRVLKAWMPASWSPSNGVTVFEQPAFAAPREVANHTPIWKVCTGLNFTPFLASFASTFGGQASLGRLPWRRGRDPWYRPTAAG